MKPQELIQLLKTKLLEDTFTYDFNREKNSLRLTHKIVGKGIDISLPPILAKYETKKEQAIEEVVYTIQQTFQSDGKRIGWRNRSIVLLYIQSFARHRFL